MIQIDPKIRTWAEIDMNALYHNFQFARNASKKVMCVIKADGYGHGAVTLGKFLEKIGAAAFAVACLDEAVILREAGISLPILILGYTPPLYAELLAHYNITATIVDRQTAFETNRAAQKAGVIVFAHIKIDTGMSRLGLFAQTTSQIQDTIQAICSFTELSNTKITGMFTHFAAADTPGENAYTQQQLKNFLYIKETLYKSGIRIPVCHASNSAAILNYPNAQLDMVREGIMLYGLYPDNQPRSNGPLRPVMSLKTRVAQVKKYPAGASISYGRTYTTATPAQIAVLTAGYADGYPRRLSNHTDVFIQGKRYPQIGRICMDMCMANVTGSAVTRGDTAVLFGNGGLALELLANQIHTINYELACLITSRVHRIYNGLENNYKQN